MLLRGYRSAAVDTDAVGTVLPQGHLQHRLHGSRLAQLRGGRQRQNAAPTLGALSRRDDLRLTVTSQGTRTCGACWSPMVMPHADRPISWRVPPFRERRAEGRHGF